MTKQRFSAMAYIENRFLYKQNFGEHMKEYGENVYETYIHAGWEESDPIKMVTGAIMVPASLLLEGPDQLYSAATGQEYVQPEGIAGRTTRDIRLLLKDAVTLHPLRVLGDGWRVMTADWMLDLGDALGGHSISTVRQKTHANAEKSLTLAI